MGIVVWRKSREGQDATEQYAERKHTGKGRPMDKEARIHGPSLACGSWLWLGGGPGRSRLGNVNRLARLYLLKAADNNPVPRPQALLYHPVAALHPAERDLARFCHRFVANPHPGSHLPPDAPSPLRHAYSAHL